MYRCRQASVALALLISWVGFVGFILTYYCCVRTLWDADAGTTIPTLTQHFLLVPIGLVIGALPLFPGGAGIAEAGFGALYGWYGCSAASGVVGMLVQRILMWGLGLLGYLAGGRIRTGLPVEKASGAKPPGTNGEAHEHQPHQTISAR
jgi:glycosyltransferase 2 family protein